MTKTIHLSEATYNKLRQSITGRIDHFVNKAITEKLSKEREISEKKYLKKQLIAGYQRRSENAKLQKDLDILSEMSLRDIYSKRKSK